MVSLCIVGPCTQNIRDLVQGSVQITLADQADGAGQLIVQIAPRPEPNCPQDMLGEVGDQAVIIMQEG